MNEELNLPIVVKVLLKQNKDLCVLQLVVTKFQQSQVTMVIPRIVTLIPCNDVTWQIKVLSVRIETLEVIMSLEGSRRVKAVKL